MLTVPQWVVLGVRVKLCLHPHPAATGQSKGMRDGANWHFPPSSSPLGTVGLSGELIFYPIGGK